MGRRLLLGLALAAAAFTAGPTQPAAAESAAEVRRLAQQAQSDPAALERLRSVDDVDGAPADFRRALDTDDQAELRRRLETVESSAGDPAGTAGSLPLGTEGARRGAEEILQSERYRPYEPPRPFRGAIRQIGAWLEPVLEPLGRLFSPIGRFFAALFDSAFGIFLLAMAVVVVTALVAARFASRRTRAMAAESDRAKAAGEESLDPRELERQADEAERAGDFERAFRLRFRAGVLRLDKAGVLHDRPSATTGELARSIRSATFKRLARAFDEIAYGGRRPEQADLQQAKSDWPKVLEESRR